jgi:UrcA family protein
MLTFSSKPDYRCCGKGQNGPDTRAAVGAIHTGFSDLRRKFAAHLTPKSQSGAVFDTQQLFRRIAMTNQNGSRRLHVRPFAIVAVLTAAVCATTQLVNADPASLGTSSVRVNFSGIDLSTSGGQEKAKERLVQAARLACRRVEDGLDLSHRENYLACVDTALSQAMPKLAQLILRRSTVQMAGSTPK